MSKRGSIKNLESHNQFTWEWVSGGSLTVKGGSHFSTSERDIFSTWLPGGLFWYKDKSEKMKWHIVLRLKAPVLTEYGSDRCQRTSSLGHDNLLYPECLVTTAWGCSVSTSSAFLSDHPCLSKVSPCFWRLQIKPSSVAKGWEWTSIAIWVLWCCPQREFNNYTGQTHCPCWWAT